MARSKLGQMESDICDEHDELQACWKIMVAVVQATGAGQIRIVEVKGIENF